MTYKICKKIIDTKDFGEKEANELRVKLNVFLLNGSISQDQYDELIVLLVEKQVG